MYYLPFHGFTDPKTSYILFFLINCGGVVLSAIAKANFVGKANLSIK